MILTINYIIDRFKDYADRHANINDFVFGNFSDSENRQYPLLNVRLEAPSYIVYWRGNFRFFHHNDFNENIGIFLAAFSRI